MRKFVLVLAAAMMCGGVTAPANGAGPLVWSGTVDRVVDGDTIRIDIAGDDKSAVHVRNAGIQAIETGQCGASEAKRALAGLVSSGQQVVLRANYANSTSFDGDRVRPLRYVDLVSGVDVQLELLKRGLVLAYPLGREFDRQDEYHRAAQEAAQKGIGLYSRTLCGPGPQQDAQLRVWVNWDADGYDPDNVNGEYVRILNEGSATVGLSGWWLRSPTNQHYRMPAGTSISPGRHLTVHSGSGRDSSADKYWGGSSSRFYNPDPKGVHAFGAYLFDPDGDLRSWSMYPCTWGCVEPLSTGSNVSWTANYDPPGDERTTPNLETVDLRNTSTQRIDASYRVVTLLGRVLEFGPGSYLDPGETLRVHMGRGSESRLHKYVGSGKVLLANSGGSVVLRNTEGVQIGCASWGDRGPSKYWCTRTVARTSPVQAGAGESVSPTPTYAAPQATVSLRVVRRSKLKVDAGPALSGKAGFRVKIQRRSGHRWVTYRKVSTIGKSERVTVNVPRGTYRVRLANQRGYLGVVSSKRFVAR